MDRLRCGDGIFQMNDRFPFVSVLNWHPYRIAADLPSSQRPLKRAYVRFVQTEFPFMLRPRMVIEFSGGLSLLLEAAPPSRSPPSSSRSWVQSLM